MKTKLLSRICAALVAGLMSFVVQAAGPDEFCPNTLPQTPDTMLMWRNVDLTDLAGVDAYMTGASINTTGTPMGGCYCWNCFSNETPVRATCQIQLYDGTHTKVCFLELTQVGTDVYGCVTRAAYANKQNVLGSDMTGKYTGYTIATSPSVRDYGVYALSPIYKNKPLAYDRGKTYTWNGGVGADWKGAGNWLDADGQPSDWKEWALAAFPANSTLTVNDLVRIGGDVVATNAFPAGTTTITGTGALAFRVRFFNVINATADIQVPVSFLQEQTSLFRGPGRFQAASASGASAYYDLYDGAELVIGAFEGAAAGRPVFYTSGGPCTNLIDLGGAYVPNLPAFGGTGADGASGILRNVVLAGTADFNFNKRQHWFLETGAVITNAHRLQINNGHITVRTGGKYVQNCPNSVNTGNYGTLIGLDMSNTESSFTVDGGTVEINATPDLFTEQYGGFAIACKGGSYDNTTGTVTIASGSAKVATITMTSDWQIANVGKGWRSGSCGHFVQTGGTLETVKIFAGNTSAGGAGNTQSWSFTGGTGTIGSIRSGTYTPCTWLMDGYTVKALADTDAWFTRDAVNLSVTDAQSFTIGANGLVFDTNGKSVGTDFSFWSVRGPLTKAGEGTLTLNGLNTSAALSATAGTLAFGRPATVGSLALASGASLGFVAGSNSVASVTTPSVTLPESGAVTVKLTGFAPTPGRYALVVAPNLDAARFTLDATGITDATLTATLSATASALILTVTSSSTPPPQSGDFIWTGAAGDGRMGTADNWLGGVVPGAGANVIFDSALAATVENDLTDFAPATVTFSANSGVRTVTGNAFTGVGTIVNASPYEVRFAAAVTFAEMINLRAETANVDFAGGVTGTLCANLTDLARIHKGVYTLTAETWESASGIDIVASGSTFNFPGEMQSVSGAGSGKFIVRDGATATLGTVRGDTKSYGYEWYAEDTGVLNISNRAYTWGWETRIGSDVSTGTINLKGLYSASDAATQIRGRRVNFGADGITFGPHYSNGKKKSLDLYGNLTLGATADWTLQLSSDPANLRLYTCNDAVVTFDTLDALDGTTPRTITIAGHINSANPSTAKHIQTGPGTVVFGYANSINYVPYELREGMLKFVGNGYTGVAPLTTAAGTRLEIEGGRQLPMTITAAGTVAFAKGVTETAAAVEFRDGAALVFTVDRTLPAVLRTTGGLTLGESLTVTAEFPEALADGDYALITGANLTEADLARFTLARTGTGWTERMTGTLAVKNGDLVITVGGSSYGVPYLRWRGAASAIWTDGAYWLPQDGDANQMWQDAATAIFDSSSSDVTLADDVKVRDILVTGGNDVTFAGAGTLIGVGVFAKGGTGTATWNGPTLTQQELLITNGVFVLGTDAPAGALGGPDAGAITIRDGGTFELNIDFSNADAQNEITHQKRFVIEGDGYQGQGAIVNNGSADTWNAALRNVTLTGDATVGGTKRFDVRDYSGTASKEPLGVFGKGHTLTVKTTAGNGFAVVNGTVDVEKLVIRDGGVFRPEGSTFVIPGGVEIRDGTLQTYGNTYSADVPVVANNSASRLDKQSGTTTFNGPFTVAAGATLTSPGGNTVDLVGAITNKGTIASTAGTLQLKGFLSTEGAVNASSGQLRVFTPSIEGEGTMSFTGAGVNFGGQITNFNARIAATMTGGSIWWAEKSTSTTEMPKFGPNGCFALTMTGGSMGFNIVNDYTINGANFSINASDHARKGSLYFVDQAGTLGANKTVTLEDVDWSVATWMVGYSSLQMPNIVFKSGVIRAGTLQCRDAWRDPNTVGELLRLEGGELRLTHNGSGSTIGNGLCAWTHFDPFFQANSGTLAFDSDSNVEQMRAAAFGDRAGGKVTVDLNGKTVDWKTGVAGLADVELTGGGTFKSGHVLNVKETHNAVMQGVVGGKWTISNTGVNDLSGVATFGGGLELGEGVTASVRIHGTNMMETVYLQNGKGSFDTSCGYGAKTLPFVCSDGELFHLAAGEEYTNGNFLYKGRFYVEEESDYTFAGGYDDGLFLAIDGTQVFKWTTWNPVQKTTTHLTKGWHSFFAVEYQITGGIGASVAGWKGVLNLGWAKGTLSDTTAADYTRFSPDKVPMKRSNSVNWDWRSMGSSLDNSWSTRTDWEMHTTTNGLAFLNTKSVAVTPTLGKSLSRFSGYVYVSPDKAGTWHMQGNYDDRCSLKIDGTEITFSTSSPYNATTDIEVTAGWHAFEARVYDYGGGWGNWNNYDWIFRAQVNGGDWVNFDERNFDFRHDAPGEHPGLYGTTTLAAGSTLANDTTVNADESCRIWGTLEGAGALTGPFRFEGDSSAWHVRGDRRRITEKVDFAGVTNADAFIGLKKVAVDFAEDPRLAAYDLAAAGDLTAEQAAAITVEAKGASGALLPGWKAEVRTGRLVLVNPKPEGFAIFIR